MLHIPLSKRCDSFCFNEIDNFKTYVYVIRGKEHTFVIDTFCGPEYMEEIDKIMTLSAENTLVVNTHFHWDHIWGNCFFKDKIIIAHKSCHALIKEQWQNMAAENAKHLTIKTKMYLPNLLFDNTLSFPEDDIEIFYSPGHTKDCITIYDSKDNYLYVGDNMEKPKIFVESPDINSYIDTLRKYQKYHSDKIFAGHTLFLNNDDIEHTIVMLSEAKHPVFC